MRLSWRVRRAALGIRQRDVANQAGISQARFSLLERGEAIPTEDEDCAVEKVLKIPEDIAKVLVETGWTHNSKERLLPKRPKGNH
jgi:transcriptional regulator with XRE-family HTH domain